MKIRKLDHYNLKCSNRKETLHFYCKILGLEDGSQLRAASSVPGAWLLVDGHPAVHIEFIAEKKEQAHTGAIDHIAFEATGCPEFEATFARHGIAYEKIDRSDRGLIQLFVTDPNGVKIEINIRSYCPSRNKASNSEA